MSIFNLIVYIIKFILLSKIFEKLVNAIFKVNFNLMKKVIMRRFFINKYNYLFFF